MLTDRKFAITAFTSKPESSVETFYKRVNNFFENASFVVSGPVPKVMKLPVPKAMK